MRNKKGQFIKGHTPVFSEEHKLNISKGLQGHSVSRETREKISLKLKGRKVSAESKRKMSLAQKGRIISKEHRDRLSVALKGRKRTSEERRKMSAGHSGKKRHYCTGEKNFFWKGGITEKNKAIRTSLEYRQWRKKVYERDNYTCQRCNKRGVNLNADHIKPFALYPELRLRVSNGRTLCIPCHRKTRTYGINQWTTKN